MTLVAGFDPGCIGRLPPMRESPALVESCRFGTRRVPCCARSAGWRGLARLHALPAARRVARPGAGAVRRHAALARARPVLAALRRLLRLPGGARRCWATGLRAVSRALQRDRARLALATSRWPPAPARQPLRSCSACCWPSPAPAGVDDLGRATTTGSQGARAGVRNPVTEFRAVVLADQGHLFPDLARARRRAGRRRYLASSCSRLSRQPPRTARSACTAAWPSLSWRVVTDNPVAMALRAGPHRGPTLPACRNIRWPGDGASARIASWYAYRDLVDSSGSSRAGLNWQGAACSATDHTPVRLTFGVTAFMLYMVFIILQPARESKAAKFNRAAVRLGVN